jgi:transposase
MFKVTFSNQTVKRFKGELQKAYARGDLRSVRRLSVLIMIGERQSMETIQASWDVSRSTVHHWLKEFVVAGWKSLVYGKMPGRPSRLSKTQKRQLSNWIKAGPEACGYPTGCWTSVLIQDLIYQRFHVLYNRFYVCELLHHLGFSHQKARFVSDHLDEEARQRWMKEKWPEILAQARKIGAPIFFGDETSFALWGSLAYTWAPIGQQPQVKTTGLRKGYKVFGVIEFFSGRLIYQGLEDRFNSASYQAFLQSLLAQFSGPTLLIQDGAKYHTSQATRDFFKQHADRLIVHQLPSYSPDYNPIEYLWKKVKTKATHNRYFEEFAKLIRSVEDALAVLATQADEIKRLMGVYTKHMAEPQFV